jgi:anti-sigma-K factor RskA
MNVTCKDRDRIFEVGSPAEWAALEAHAAACASCAEELRAWRSLSLAAEELRDYTESPSLWPRIQRALTAESARAQGGAGWNWRSLWPSLSLSWQTAAALAFALALLVSAGWFFKRPIEKPAPSASLLKRDALADVERAESAYAQAIDKLAAQAKPQLENPETPLTANYREKLLVLDSAIDDLRAQAGQNPSNAHLRSELLAMYQEKQRTLEEVLEEKR